MTTLGLAVLRTAEATTFVVVLTFDHMITELTFMMYYDGEETIVVA